MRFIRASALPSELLQLPRNSSDGKVGARMNELKSAKTIQWSNITTIRCSTAQLQRASVRANRDDALADAVRSCAFSRFAPRGRDSKAQAAGLGAGQTTAESPNGARLVGSCEVVFPSCAPLGQKRGWVRRSPGLRPGLSSLAPLGLKTATKIAAVQCKSATSKNVSEGES